MFIQPMNGMHLVGQINGFDGFKGRTTGLQDSFLGIFKDAINNVRETDLKTKENAILTATGNEDAIHNSLIDEARRRRRVRARRAGRRRRRPGGHAAGRGRQGRTTPGEIGRAHV